MVRLPATCRGCGARVELSIGETAELVAQGHDSGTREALPTQWVEVGSTQKHACKANGCSVSFKGQLSEPGDRVNDPRLLATTTKAP